MENLEELVRTGKIDDRVLAAAVRRLTQTVATASKELSSLKKASVKVGGMKKADPTLTDFSSRIKDLRERLGVLATGKAVGKAGDVRSRVSHTFSASQSVSKAPVPSVVAEPQPSIEKFEFSPDVNKETLVEKTLGDVEKDSEKALNEPENLAPLNIKEDTFANIEERKDFAIFLAELKKSEPFEKFS